MRKYLRKPSASLSQGPDWKALHHKALEMTSSLDPKEDPRVRLLRGSEDSEKVMRSLSIIGMADLQREFAKKS